jgi:LDH2 family malate/lactate/ureidoglycolate dehydrogenase
MPEQKYSYEQLFDFTKAILQKIGCSEEHAATSAKVLLSADLRALIRMAWQD